jgi:hypothetical protein
MFTVGLPGSPRPPGGRLVRCQELAASSSGTANLGPEIIPFRSAVKNNEWQFPTTLITGAANS